MAVKSQNGYSANDRSVIGSYSVPGGKVALRQGDVSVILLWVLHQYHNTVEPLVWPGIWGYAERLIRGSSDTLSNHASGTAFDANAPQHPLGTYPEANFSKAEILAIRAILAFCGGVVRWGGDYTGRKDGMHFEIVGGTVQVRELADKIRALQGAPVVQGEVVSNVPTPTAPVTSGILQRGVISDAVRIWQGELWRLGIGVGAHDSDFGEATEIGTRRFQDAAGIGNDGKVGPETRAAASSVPNYPKPEGPTMTFASAGGNYHTIYAFQAKLRERGWTIKVDGEYGKETARIISAFQQEKRLHVDGVGGAETWIAMYTRSR